MQTALSRSLRKEEKPLSGGSFLCDFKRCHTNNFWQHRQYLLANWVNQKGLWDVGPRLWSSEMVHGGTYQSQPIGIKVSFTLLTFSKVSNATHYILLVHTCSAFNLVIVIIPLRLKALRILLLCVVQSPYCGPTIFHILPRDASLAVLLCFQEWIPLFVIPSLILVDWGSFTMTDGMIAGPPWLLVSV